MGVGNASCVRQEELRALLVEFTETIGEKQQLVETEQDLLAQMQVRLSVYP